MANESNALVPIKVTPSTALLPSKDDLQIIKLLAETALHATSMLPRSIKTPADAAAIMLAGLELGVRPFTALRHIFIVNGKAEPDAQIMAGVVQAAEPSASIEIVTLDDAQCTMRIRRPKRGVVAEFTYYLADAQKAGLTGQDNWKKYPKDMMRWAATKRLCRAYAPDLINAVETLDVGTVAAAMTAVEVESSPVIDVKMLPLDALYSEGDDPATDADFTIKDALERITADEDYARLRAAAVAAFGQGQPPTDEQIDTMNTGGLEWPDAEAIAAAVWSWPDMDVPLAAVVSRVHADRAMAGQPFNEDAINDVDTQRMADHAIEAAAAPEPDAPTQEPKRRATAQPKLEV